MTAPLYREPLVYERRAKVWKLLQDGNATIGRKFYEGVVAKRRDAGYPVCTRAKQKTHLWIKHRFDQKISMRVNAQRR
jgi:hypothetical protein